MKHKTDIECPLCRKMFVQIRSTQKYCSAKCKQAAHRIRHPNTDQMNYAGRIHNMLEDAKANGRTDELVRLLRDATHDLFMFVPSELDLRRQMQKHHPDRGGDPAKFRTAQQAWAARRARW